MSNPIQNFYKSTITQDWSIGPGNFYVSVKPSTSVGRLVVSPSSDTLREIIEYTNTGTDGNGDYIVISTRGVGGTTEQSHTVGEKVRMNITAEDWEDMRDDIDSIVAAGAVNASVTERGIVQIATDAEVLAGTETGATTAKLVVTPKTLDDNLKTIVYSKIIAPIVRVYTSNATWTKPAGLRYIEVEVQGGGGGGCDASGTSTADSAGQGGGAGGYSKKLIQVESLGSTESITVGAGGVRGRPGTNGNNSIFGSIITSNGGNGGGTLSGFASGGTSSGGDINIIGGMGGCGESDNNFAGGLGGLSYFSGGYGAGGKGGNKASSSVLGLNGNNGIVIVKEFYI